MQWFVVLFEVLRPHLTLFAGNVPQIVLLLLLSYCRCLWIISEALELRVLGERVSHSWCMGEVCHGYGDWLGAEMDVVCMRGKWGCSHIRRCQNTSRARGDTLMTPVNTAN